MTINEFGLLLAVSLPVATIVGLQVFLYASGERGIGLVPGFTQYPSIEIGRAGAEAATEPAACEPATVLITIGASNDEEERLAA